MFQKEVHIPERFPGECLCILRAWITSSDYLSLTTAVILYHFKNDSLLVLSILPSNYFLTLLPSTYVSEFFEVRNLVFVNIVIT